MYFKGTNPEESIDILLCRTVKIGRKAGAMKPEIEIWDLCFCYSIRFTVNWIQHIDKAFTF